MCCLFVLLMPYVTVDDILVIVCDDRGESRKKFQGDQLKYFFFKLSIEDDGIFTPISSQNLRKISIAFGSF